MQANSANEEMISISNEYILRQASSKIDIQLKKMKNGTMRLTLRNLSFKLRSNCDRT